MEENQTGEAKTSCQTCERSQFGPLCPLDLPSEFHHVTEAK